MSFNKANRRKRIHFRIRKKIQGTAERPRLAVYRSNKEIYAQLIDDLAGRTLASASSRDKGMDNSGTKVEVSKRVSKKEYTLTTPALYMGGIKKTIRNNIAKGTANS